MSRGNDLQEMEVGTTQSKSAVNAGAKPAEGMPGAGTNASGITTPGQGPSYEDLGGPSPDNYKPDDDSAKLKTPGASLSQVKDVVNAKAKPADAMKSMSAEEVETEEEAITEEEVTTDEVVSESEEITETEEAVASIEEAIEEDVNALLSGEDLSEEFRDKAKTVFEAAMNARTQQIEEAVTAHYDVQFNEQVEELNASLTERLDAYLEYVAEEWFQENALAVEKGIQAQATESFLSGLKGLFEEHYVSIPEEKYDVLESMVEKLDEMESKLNEQLEKNVALNKRLAESVTDVIFAEVSEGLALSQKEKLATLVENVEFGSEQDYREKLVTLKESYFSSNTVTQRDSQDYIAEDATTLNEQVDVSGSMGMYLEALQRVSKK
jgi:outer membrane protein OmpA-like peptidoglycan-associated protein